MADPPDLGEGIAMHLAEQDLVTFDPTGVSGDCFLESMPSTSGVVVVLTVYDDRVEPDSLLPYDEPRLQVRVRGTRDPRVSRRRCAAIRSELHGLGPITLPNGLDLILSVCLQGAPGAMGVDENARHEHVCNFRMEHVSSTAHRV